MFIARSQLTERGPLVRSHSISDGKINVEKLMFWSTVRLQNPKQLWNRTYFRWAPDPKVLEDLQERQTNSCFLCRKNPAGHHPAAGKGHIGYDGWWHPGRAQESSQEQFHGRAGRPHGDLSGGGNSASPCRKCRATSTIGMPEECLPVPGKPHCHFGWWISLASKEGSRRKVVGCPTQSAMSPVEQRWRCF